VNSWNPQTSRSQTAVSDEVKADFYPTLRAYWFLPRGRVGA